MVRLSADQFGENLLESSGADVKRSRLEGRNGNLMWKWTLEYLDHLWLHVHDEGMRTATTQGEIPTVPPPAPPPEEHVPEMRGQGVHAKALRIRAFWSEIGRTPRMPGMQDSRSGEDTLANAKHIKMPGTRAVEPHQRRRRNVELLQIQIHDHWTRVEVRWILSRRGQNMTSVTDNENLADRMDEDNFRRGPATSHQLEPVDDENVSKKARVARNVLHIRGEDSVKLDVNEEAWPNADLAIHSSLRRCLDRRTSRRQSQGWR